MAIKNIKRSFSFLNINGTTHYPVMHREIKSFVEDFIGERDRPQY
jgi:hypothetical protein